MPPLPPVANVVKFVLQLKGNDGRKSENIFHWGYTGSLPSAGACTTFATQLWDQWVANFIPLIQETTSLTLVTCTDLSSDTAGQGEYDNGGTPHAGSLAGGVVPLSAALLVNKEINRLYRGGHPRTYLTVGDATKLTDDGDWSSVFVTAVYGAYTSVASDLEGTAADGCILSTEVCVSYINKTLYPTPPHRYPVPQVYGIEAVTAEAQLATQRRRVRRTSRHR